MAGAVGINKHLKALQPRRRFNAVLAGVVAVAVIGIGYYVISTRAATGTATLSLAPASAIVANGATFTVDVREDSGAASVNAVQADLTYPSAKLELVGIDASNSAFPLEAQSTGSAGVITMARALNGGQAPVTGSQLVARLTFKSLMATGSAVVAFSASSAVVSSADNTALTLTTTGGTYAPDTAAPSVPAGLHTTATTGSSISLAWSAANDNVAVAGYGIYRDGVKVGSPVSTTFTDTGLAMGTTHTYAVSALDAAGNESAKSGTITAATLDTAAPAMPTGLTLQALSYNQIKLTWNASTDTGGSGLAGYRIYRNGSTTAVGAAVTATFTDTGLSGSTSYSYTVSAYDGAGNESAKTAPQSIATPAPPDTTPPTAPTSFHAATITLTGLSLAWTASTDNVAVSGYRLFRDGTLIASPVTATFTDSGLTYGTDYTYTLRAIDPSGNLSGPATLNVSTLPLKIGDLNLDNLINVFDLSLLLSHWNTTTATADLNHDNTVNIFDLSMLLTNWGK